MKLFLSHRLVRLLGLMALAALLAACSPSGVYTRWNEFVAEQQGLGARQLALPDGHLLYRDGGKGQPVLLIHGFGGDGLVNWKPQMLDLVRDHRVIVPDLLWFGGSTASRRPSLDAQADALAALVTRLDLHRVEVVGISYGGFVAMELVRRLPDRIGRMVIVNSPGPVYTEADFAGLLQRGGVKSAEALFVPDSAAAMRRLTALVYSDKRDAPDWVLDDFRQHYVVGHEPQLRALMQDLTGFMQRYRERFPAGTRWPQPVVVWSEGDRVFPLPIGKRLATAIGAKLIEVPGAGHNLPVDKPEAASRALRAALAG